MKKSIAVEAIDYVDDTLQASRVGRYVRNFFWAYCAVCVVVPIGLIGQALIALRISS